MRSIGTIVDFEGFKSAYGYEHKGRSTYFDGNSLEK